MESPHFLSAALLEIYRRFYTLSIRPAPEFPRTVDWALSTSWHRLLPGQI
jgi:hypothetical protein